MSEGSALGGLLCLLRGNQGMGEGSAHSERYFAPVYLAKVEGNAHSGLHCEEGERKARAARIRGVAWPRDT